MMLFIRMKTLLPRVKLPSLRVLKNPVRALGGGKQSLLVTNKRVTESALYMKSFYRSIGEKNRKENCCCLSEKEIGPHVYFERLNLKSPTVK